MGQGSPVTPLQELQLTATPTVAVAVSVLGGPLELQVTLAVTVAVVLVLGGPLELQVTLAVTVAVVLVAAAVTVAVILVAAAAGR